MGLSKGVILSVLLVLTLVNIEYSTIAWAKTVTKFTNLKCESLDENLVVFQECRLRMIKRNLAAMNVYAKLLKPVTNALINLDLYKKANGYKPFLYNTTFNFCQLSTKQVLRNIIAKIAFNFINEFSNLNHSCPYDHDIFMKNVILSEDKFRLIPLPSGEYLLKIVIVVDKATKVILQVFVDRTE